MWDAEAKEAKGQTKEEDWLGQTHCHGSLG